MGNTYAKLYIHIVFAVKNRESVLDEAWREGLFQYIGGVIRQNNQTPIIIGGWRDHIHILLGGNASINIAALVRSIKLASHKWIEQKICHGFAWQDGYGCFSVSATHLDAVRNYIANQDRHHSAIGVDDEFRQLLVRNNIGYDERFLPVPE